MLESLNEEIKYEFTHFNADTAYEIGKYCVEYSKIHNLSICIDIYAYSKQLFHYSSDACTRNNDDFLMKKRNAVLYFGHSTKFLSIKNKNDASVLQTKYGLELGEYCITMGGFPIKIKDSGIVGAICISGLNPEEDHELITIILDWYFNNFSA